MMFYSLRLALRHFFRKKIYSTIIVLSLTAGFTCTCLLVSFLVSESSVDSFHANVDRTWQLNSNDPFGGAGRLTYGTRWLRDYLGDTYPEIESICLVSALSLPEIELGPGNFASLDGCFSSPEFHLLPLLCLHLDGKPFGPPFRVHSTRSGNSVSGSQATDLDLINKPSPTFLHEVHRPFRQMQ